MTRTSPELRRLAERLLGHEAPGKHQGTAAFRVAGKFRDVLAPILGSAGFRTLLMRALTLARAETAELVAVQVTAEGLLEGPIQPGAAEAEVVLIGGFLALLVDFIGAELVTSLVLEEWPRGLKGTSGG
jgi:hypothetical protein